MRRILIRGRGQAVVGADTTPVEPGSVMFVPQNTPHGLVNPVDQPLEYFVVHSPQTSAAAFRRRAALPGPHCQHRVP
jgi:mannose-6-phosphate isomerase-like protein (cupin superfamily)